MIRQFLETKWYIHSVLVLLFLVFAATLIRGHISDSYYVITGDSMLIPLYAKSFSWIIACSNFIKPFAASLGIILLYKKIKAGWILAMSSLSCMVMIYSYWFATGMISTESYTITETILVALYLSGIACLSHKDIQQQFKITIRTYVLSFLGAFIVSLIQIFAFEISMQLIYI